MYKNYAYAICMCNAESENTHKYIQQFQYLGLLSWHTYDIFPRYGGEGGNGKIIIANDFLSCIEYTCLKLQCYIIFVWL